MPIFAHAVHLETPSTSLVAFLKCDPKFININQLVPGNAPNTQWKGFVEEALQSELDIFPLRLIRLNRCLFLCDPYFFQPLRNRLLVKEFPSGVVNMNSHLLIGCIWIGNDEHDKIGQVDPNQLRPLLVPRLEVAFWPVIPAVEGGIRHVGGLSIAPLVELL